MSEIRNLELPLNIAIFSDCYRPRINGVVTSIESELAGLLALGHKVTLITPSYPNQSSQSEPGIVRLPSHAMRRWPDDRSSIPWPPSLIWKLYRTKWDVIHLHTPFNLGLLGLLFARRRPTPVVFTHHTQWEEYSHYIPYIWGSWARRLARRICDFFFDRASLIVCPSAEIQLSLNSRRPELHTTVLPTGIDAELFENGDPQPIFEELNLPQDTQLLVYVGRLGPEKSVDFLLQCHRKLLETHPDAHLLVIGGGPGTQALEELNQSMNLVDRCHFLGWRPRETLRDYFAAARAFVFASQTETQGLVLLEAAAAALPVVAVRASGVNEAVLDGKTGLLSDPGDHTAFVTHIQQLLDDPIRQRAVGQQARQHVKAFSSRECVAKLLDCFRTLTR
jgi:1,2-diacylglycerol 3-alpha-glucosyltransferase